MGSNHIALKCHLIVVHGIWNPVSRVCLTHISSSDIVIMMIQFVDDSGFARKHLQYSYTKEVSGTAKGQSLIKYRFFLLSTNNFYQSTFHQTFECIESTFYALHKFQSVGELLIRPHIQR